MWAGCPRKGFRNKKYKKIHQFFKCTSIRLQNTECTACIYSVHCSVLRADVGRVSNVSVLLYVTDTQHHQHHYQPTQPSRPCCLFLLLIRKEFFKISSFLTSGDVCTTHRLVFIAVACPLYKWYAVTWSKWQPLCFGPHCWIPVSIINNPIATIQQSYILTRGAKTFSKRHWHFY